ncbi:MAG: glycosyltransferase family 9 protein [Candidatus Aminicenantales bacterium]
MVCPLKNLLLWRMGGLGDLLVALPSINLLRKTFSPCLITLICRPEYGALLQQTNVVDKLVSVEASWIGSFFSPAQPPDSQFSAWLDKFDSVIGWFNSKQNFLWHRLLAFKRQPEVNLIVARSGIEEPLSQYFFRKTSEIFLQKKSIPNFNDFLLLPLSKRQQKEGLKLLGSKFFEKEKKLVIIHPGSGSRPKCWPLPNFLSIIKRLAGRRVKGALITGEAENWLEEGLKSYTWPETWTWLKNPSLIKLAGLLSQALFYIGNDSGVTHLAAACGARSLALFRQDLEKVWQPAGLISTVSAPTLSQISQEEVWEKLINWL